MTRYTVLYLTDLAEMMGLDWTPCFSHSRLILSQTLCQRLTTLRVRVTVDKRVKWPTCPKVLMSQMILQGNYNQTPCPTNMVTT